MFGIGDDHRKYWILVAMGAMLGVILLAETVVGVALRTIQHDLGISEIAAHWVVNIYMLVLAGLAAASGKLADIIGHKAVTITGLLIFGLGSLACGFADSGVVLLAARGVQGLGAAVIFPASLAMVAIAFPAKQRGSAIGSAAAIGTVFLALGPLMGGFLTDALSWRWIFWVNIPFVLAIGVIVLAAWTDPPREAAAEPLDKTGLVLLVGGLCMIVFAIMQAPDWGWSDPAIWLLFVAGLVLLVVFALVERRTSTPLIEVDLFADPTFTGCNLVIFTAQYSKMAVFVFGALYLQDILDMTPLIAGLALLPTVAAQPVLAPLSGRAADRFGARWPSLFGVLALTVGMAWIGVTAPWDTYALLVPGLIAWGLALSFVFVPPRRAVMNAVSQSMQGEASGISMTSQLLGATIGMAVCSALFSMTRDFQVVFLANAGFSLSVLAISWLTIERPGRAGQAKVVGG